jgi:hypothetical protein
MAGNIRFATVAMPVVSSLAIQSLTRTKLRYSRSVSNVNKLPGVYTVYISLHEPGNQFSGSGREI